jgi:hypothetical protein
VVIAPAATAGALPPLGAKVHLPGADRPPGAGQAEPEPAACGVGARYDTPTGQPCPRSVRPDGSVAGDGACHECGLGPACPLRDPWAEGLLD